MSQFGNVAVSAAQSLQQNPTMRAKDAWNLAMNQTNLLSSSKDKGCVKCAFIDLCESGQVLGVPPVKQISLGWNGLYAVLVVVYLRQKGWQRRPANTRGRETKLWNLVLKMLQKSIKPNSQMDVVLSLWDAGLIT